MVKGVKIFKTEKIIEIQLVMPTEVRGKVLSEKDGYKSVKTALVLSRCGPPKQRIVCKQRPFYNHLYGF